MAKKKRVEETALAVQTDPAAGTNAGEQAAQAPAGKKLSIYEYEQRYVKRENVRGAKFALRFTVVVIGIVLAILFFLVALRVYDVHPYAGYAAGVVCLALYIALFIVPVFKILHADYFITNVNVYTARGAQKHNRKVRHSIADRIIDLTASVEGVGWYNSEVVGRLAVAMRTNNEPEVKRTLTELYKGSIKRSAKDLIFRSSLKSATYSAISQTAKIDAALVVFVNLQLIKDLVFLYGFRPSDAKLARIFGRVIQNSLIAYGVGGMNIGSTVVKTMGDAVKGIPILGSAISAIVDSSVQGLTNGVLTTVIGYQTIRYLMQEYRLQDILDGVDVSETQEEFQEACDDLESQLKKKKKLAPAV